MNTMTASEKSDKKPLTQKMLDVMVKKLREPQQHNEHIKDYHKHKLYEFLLLRQPLRYAWRVNDTYQTLPFFIKETFNGFPFQAFIA